jgi:TonB family protein
MASRRVADLGWKLLAVLLTGVILVAGSAAIASAFHSLAAAPPAAAKTTPRLQAYFATDFTDTGYQQAAVAKVLKSWKVSRPLPAAGKKTVVISTIGRDGALLDTRFNLNSGQKAFDDAALAAVKGAAPFAGFPKNYTRPTLEVHWHFAVENR